MAATTDRELAISQDPKPHDRDTEADSIAYYEDQAETFLAETGEVDMAELYARFLDHVPPGGHILDAGCGSGRDAHAFRSLGYPGHRGSAGGTGGGAVVECCWREGISDADGSLDIWTTS